MSQTACGNKGTRVEEATPLWVRVAPKEAGGVGGEPVVLKHEALVGSVGVGPEGVLVCGPRDQVDLPKGSGGSQQLVPAVQAAQPRVGGVAPEVHRGVACRARVAEDEALRRAIAVALAADYVLPAHQLCCRRCGQVRG